MSNPLAGRRIIELGTMIAAPFASHILVQLGAEVIKIESPAGDTTRHLVRGGPSGTFIAYNYGKKSLCIDLSSAQGTEAFRKLAETADAVIHNLSPPAARKLGVTRSALAEVNAELVVCHISGYGEGPQEDELASNPVAEAATGAMYDHRVDGRPSRLGPSYHDQFAGCYAVIRLLATWLQTDAPVSSREIRVGLYETGLHLAGRDLAGAQLKTQLLGRPSKQAGGEFAMPGYGAYVSNDGRWVYLMILTDAHWAKLTSALSMPEHDDPELCTLRGRKRRREEVEEAVRLVIGQIAFDELTEKLSRHGLGFTEVVPLERVLDSPQARIPGKLRSVDWRGMQFRIPQFPTGSYASNSVAPPELGEHSVELLAELGYSPRERNAILESGSVQALRDGTFTYAPVSRD